MLAPVLAQLWPVGRGEGGQWVTVLMCTGQGFRTVTLPLEQETPGEDTAGPAGDCLVCQWRLLGERCLSPMDTTPHIAGGDYPRPAPPSLVPVPAMPMVGAAWPRAPPPLWS